MLQVSPAGPAWAELEVDGHVQMEGKGSTCNIDVQHFCRERCWHTKIYRRLSLLLSGPDTALRAGVTDLRMAHQLTAHIHEGMTSSHYKQQLGMLLLLRCHQLQWLIEK